MRLCGINSRFQLLSPSMRQVAHALLTRPPLSYFKIWPKPRQRSNSVRLACVRHAASVHPEPGSNSQVDRFNLGTRLVASPVRYYFWFVYLWFPAGYHKLFWINSLNFSGLHYCLFVKVLCSCRISRSNSVRISLRSFAVKNFFIFWNLSISIATPFWAGISYYSIGVFNLQQLF